jgi:hypothetical protein
VLGPQPPARAGSAPVVVVEPDSFLSSKGTVPFAGFREQWEKLFRPHFAWRSPRTSLE